MEYDICFEAEADEQWSFVENKKNRRWLCYAIEKETRRVLAFLFGKRTDQILKKLINLLSNFNITKYYTDGWNGYNRILPNYLHIEGKTGTQRIERANLTLRTNIKRLQRKTICFSKSEELHDKIIGSFINQYFF